MNTYAIFRRSDGYIVTHRICSLQDLAINVPDGCSAVPGQHDPESTRVVIHKDTDAETGAVIESYQVVDYQPPQPSLDHEWNAATKRWQLTKEAQATNAADKYARAELARLDESMLRPLGELAIDPNNTDALLRIDAIVSRKIELRAKLKR